MEEEDPDIFLKSVSRVSAALENNTTDTLSTADFRVSFILIKY